MRRNSASAIVAALAVALLPGCANDASRQPPVRGAEPGQRLPLAAEEQLLERHRLVTRGDLRAAPAGSAQRAFYEYWSALENEEWTIAIEYFAPVIQRRLGTQSLVAALRIEAQAPPVKPLIRSVRTARGRQTSVRYYLRRDTGMLRATSMVWRRDGARWHIVYCSTLDESYAQAVQQRAQDEADPRPADAAQRGGARARAAQAAAADAILGR
ncbi:MAG: hypothetical protein Q8K79_17945 [Solirubrobacteraceae bacterium]|nr:hypothetical protein [Solirubrobacteraceae bacterium]